MEIGDSLCVKHVTTSDFIDVKIMHAVTMTMVYTKHPPTLL